MSSMNEAQIKAALSAARDLSALKHARRHDADLLRRDIPERTQTRNNEHAVKDLLATFLNHGGFPIDKFEEIRARNQAALRRAVERQRAEAVGRSAQEKATLYNGLENRRKAIEQLRGLTAPAAAQFPFRIWLDKPFLIWPTQGLFFEDSHYESWKSWGKVKIRSERSSYEELSFYFLWDNPSDAYAVVNVNAWLMAHGHLFAGADGGFWAGNRYASVDVSAKLYVWEWWNQPPTQAASQADQSQSLAYLRAYGGDMFDVGDVEAADVFRTRDLRHELLLVPPHGVTVLEVVLAITLGIGDDSLIDVDFASGDFEALCPFVRIELLTPPPAVA